MARTRKATQHKEAPVTAPESTPTEELAPTRETATEASISPSAANTPLSDAASEPDIPAAPINPTADEAPSSPPGRAWTERFIQPIKYSRSNFKHPEKGHLIAFRFDLPPGETKPGEELLAVLRNHKVFRQGRPVGLNSDAGRDRDDIQTGLHYEDFGPGLGKLWVMPNGELGRTVADSLDQALYGLAKKAERAATRSA